MISAEKHIENIRSGKLDLHCVSVLITQKFKEGLTLKGYGTIKINKVGTIYLEFICLEDNLKLNKKTTSFQASFPDDPFDQDQKLYLEATTLDGDKVFAKEFSIRLNMFARQPPYRFHILLHEISFTNSEESQGFESKSYIYFEFLEKPRIPANKRNSEKNSYGEESHSWNESEIKIEDTTITIIDRNDRVEARARGDFDSEELYQAMIFYIGLSSGSLPQPYCFIERTDCHTTMHFKSVRINLRGKSIPAPITENFISEGFPACHYAILPSILKLKREHPLRFESAFSQWKRVWHSFQSENDIAMLSLGVAVEGILNDVFIPEMKRTIVDKELETTKSLLISQLDKLDARNDHKQTLISTVERWGNIHPAKALSILSDKSLVLKPERKAWIDLRNAAAHPVFKENNEARQIKERDRTANTLNLFYRLILNILKYEGPIFKFRANSQPDTIRADHIEVLD